MTGPQASSLSRLPPPFSITQLGWQGHPGRGPQVPGERRQLWGDKVMRRREFALARLLGLGWLRGPGTAHPASMAVRSRYWLEKAPELSVILSHASGTQPARTQAERRKVPGVSPSRCGAQPSSVKTAGPGGWH